MHLKEQKMFLTPQELDELGFRCVGENPKISQFARFHNPQQISLGNNVRIDDFVVMSGNVSIGSNVHFSIHSSVISPRAHVSIGNFATISFYSCITSSNDDYSGKFMTNPTLPRTHTNVSDFDVKVEEHVIIGAHSLILPGVTLNQGCAIGAYSLVKNNVPEWEVFAGVPARRIKARSKLLLDFSKDLDL
jgi:acetyltransferase-like isoleucine patch superfamily enzyme